MKIVELDTELNGILMQQILLSITGQRTVPNVFVNGKHVGGNDHVQQAFRTGKLQEMLMAAHDNSKDEEGQLMQETPFQEVLRNLIKKENNGHQVVVWSKSYCPYCSATKKLLASETDADVVIHEINEMQNGDVLHDELQAMTGQRTVPNIFINGKHVGGNSEIQELARSGKLRKLL